MAEHEGWTPHDDHEDSHRQVDENGCTYHSGRVEDWNKQSSQNSDTSAGFTGSYDAQFWQAGRRTILLQQWQSTEPAS